MIKGFSIGCSRTINLGNFESMRVEASLQIDISEKEHYDDCVIGAQRELRALLEKTYLAQRKEKAA